MLPQAQAAPRPDKLLWATINVCETKGSPNVVGIRGSMPGNGTRQRMYMRFEVQFYNQIKRRYIRAGAPSRWVSAGSARFVSGQEGYSFNFEDPPAAARFKMRGMVRYEWREAPAKGKASKREKVVKRAMKITKAGYEGVEGGKPSGHSEAVCLIDSEPAPTT